MKTAFTMEGHGDKGRRQFLQRAALLVAALPVLPLGALSFNGCAGEAGRGASSASSQPLAAQSACEWCGAHEAPPELQSAISIAPPNEPGERINISGTIFQPDGSTPAGGITLYLYHTDAQGIYAKDRPNDGRLSWRHGRLRGWLRTGADGRYEFNTIKPGAYPGRPDPAHIHVTVSGPGYPEYWIEDYLFAGDARLRERDRAGHGRGGFPHIITLSRDEQGLLRGARDIRLGRL